MSKLVITSDPESWIPDPERVLREHVAAHADARPLKPLAEGAHTAFRSGDAEHVEQRQEVIASHRVELSIPGRLIEVLVLDASLEELVRQGVEPG